MWGWGGEEWLVVRARVERGKDKGKEKQRAEEKKGVGVERKGE
jgi:hypothetical protein